MSELKPCPFCKRKAIFNEASEVYGTWFEYECECGLARVSLQVCDYMSLEERVAGAFINHQYGLKYIKRVMEKAIEIWNHRPVEDELKSRLEEAERLLKDVLEWYQLSEPNEKQIESFLKGGE